MLIARELVVVTGHGHAPFELGRRTPDLPPLALGFQQIAERIVGRLLLEPLEFGNGQIAMSGINVVEDDGSIGGKCPLAMRLGERANGCEKEQKEQRERTQNSQHGLGGKAARLQPSRNEFKLFGRVRKTKRPLKT